MYELINDPIDVVTTFTKQGPRPTSFIWKNQKYLIEKINFVYRSKQGDTHLVHFAAATTKEAYKITLNTKKLTWRLNEVYSEGFKAAPTYGYSP